MAVKRVQVGALPRNSIPDSASFVFLKADGTPRDLTTYTARIWIERGPDSVRSDVPATISDALNGEVTYVFEDGDLNLEHDTKIQAVVFNAGNRFLSDVMVVKVENTVASSGFDTP